MHDSSNRPSNLNRSRTKHHVRKRDAFVSTVHSVWPAGAVVEEEGADAGPFVPQNELKPGAYITELYPMEMKRLNKLLLRFDLRARLFDAALDELRLHFRLLPRQQVHFCLEGPVTR
jgi:hypothetical protein